MRIDHSQLVYFHKAKARPERPTLNEGGGLPQHHGVAHSARKRLFPVLPGMVTSVTMGRSPSLESK
jgi:hypothetical protein